MLRYLYKDVLNGFIVILILFSLGEIFTLISLSVAGMSIDPKGGYIFLQQIETYFAQFSFKVLHGIPRALNLTSFKGLIAYFLLQLAVLIFLLRHLDSDQKEIARLKAQIVDLTMTPAQKRKLNATFTHKTKKKFSRMKRDVGKWTENQKKKFKKKSPKKKENKAVSKAKGKI